MKKYYFLIIVALILGLVLTGCSLLSNISQVPATEQSAISYLTKHTEGDPFSTDLIADGGDPALAIDVGDVLVWNDGDTLYVKYVITEAGWCLTETHLHVAISLVDIPQKNGNPPPGQFDYKNEHECVPDYTYEIPLTWEPDDELFIAAHAVVEYNETGTFTPELTWQRSLEPDDTIFFLGYGAAWTPAQAFAIPLDPMQAVWDNGFYHPLTLSGREWASWKYAYTDPDGGSYDGYSDLRRFQATFTIPEGYTVTGGSLYAPHFTSGIPINDNVYIFVNGEDNLLFWGGTRVYTGEILGTFLGVTGRAAARGVTEPKETDRWYMPGTIPEVTAFKSGENSIDIFTEENARWGGMGKLVLELDYELTYTETAWAAGEGFPGNNWATYFKYKIQWNLLETIIVPAIGIKMTSTNSLEEDQLYKFEASGTCNWRVPPHSSGYLADAEYWLRNDAYGKGWTQMGIWSLAMWNGAPVEVEWGTYNDAHEYTFEYTPSADGMVTFFFNDDGYGDNSGFLTVKIYE